MSRRGRRMDAAQCAAPCIDGLDAYRRLAARVIAQALRDLLTRDAGAERESARRFLAGSRMLEHWCQLAEIDTAGLGRRARSLESRAARSGLARLHM